MIVLLLGDVAVATAYPLLWAIGSAVPWRLTALVDPRADANLVAWYVSVQWSLLAAGLALVAYGQHDRRGPAWWCLLALPVVFACLSFDAITGLHELLRQRSDRLLLRLFGDSAPMFYTRIWMVVLAVPLVLVMITLAWGARRYLPARVRRTALLGLALAAIGGVALEPECIPFRGASFVLVLAVALLAELVGITLMLWATADLLQNPVAGRSRSGAVQRFPAMADAAADGRRETA